MVKLFNNIPIYRRFLVLFAIMAIVSILVIVLLGNFFLTSLDTRSQAVQTSVDSQSLSSRELSNLQRMNALLQTRFNQIFASLSGVIVDPALASAGGLVSSDIASREAEFGQALQAYQANYDLTTSSNMATISLDPHQRQSHNRTSHYRGPATSPPGCGHQAMACLSKSAKAGGCASG